MDSGLASDEGLGLWGFRLEGSEFWVGSLGFEESVKRISYPKP